MNLDFDLPESDADREEPLNLTLPDSFLETMPDDSRESDVTPPTTILAAVADIASANSPSLVRHAPIVKSAELRSNVDIVSNGDDLPTDLRSPTEVAPTEMAPTELGDATAADDLLEEGANGVVDSGVVDSGEVLVQAASLGLSERHSFPKIAVFAAAPVLGSVLAVYGLFWLPGAKSDSLGLARAVPESRLPARSLDSGGEPLLAKASRESLEKEKGDSSPVRALTTKSQEGDSSSVLALTTNSQEPVVIKRDEAVMTVSVVQPVTPATSIVLITASEFTLLVEEASAALPALLSGDLSAPESVRRKGHAYMALCRLAEQFDFSNQLGLAPAVLVKVRQAERIFQQVAADLGARRDLVHIASRWWEYQQRPNSGIFLLGRVHETQPAGAGMLCWVQVGDQSLSEAIPVLLKDSRYQAGDLISVVGSVISNRRDMPADLSAGRMVRSSYDYRLQSGI